MKSHIGKSRYPKSCPRCGSRNVTSSQNVGMRCNACGYTSLRKAPETSRDFVTFSCK